MLVRVSPTAFPAEEPRAERVGQHELVVQLRPAEESMLAYMIE